MKRIIILSAIFLVLSAASLDAGTIDVGNQIAGYFSEGIIIGAS